MRLWHAWRLDPLKCRVGSSSVQVECGLWTFQDGPNLPPSAHYVKKFELYPPVERVGRVLWHQIRFFRVGSNFAPKFTARTPDPSLVCQKTQPVPHPRGQIFQASWVGWPMIRSSEDKVHWWCLHDHDGVGNADGIKSLSCCVLNGGGRNI